MVATACAEEVVRQHELDGRRRRPRLLQPRNARSQPWSACPISPGASSRRRSARLPLQVRAPGTAGLGRVRPEEIDERRVELIGHLEPGNVSSPDECDVASRESARGTRSLPVPKMSWSPQATASGTSSESPVATAPWSTARSAFSLARETLGGAYARASSSLNGGEV